MLASESFIFISLHVFNMHFFFLSFSLFPRYQLVTYFKFEFSCYLYSQRSLLKMYVETYKTSSKKMSFLFSNNAFYILSCFLPQFACYILIVESEYFRRSTLHLVALIVVKIKGHMLFLVIKTS